MYKKTELGNGVRIITEKLEQFRSVSLGIWVGAGSRDEDKKNSGISHFIEHMIFKGTSSRDSLNIAKELDAIGGLSNAFTGKEYTCFHSKVLNKHFHVLADILSDIFLNSAFEPQNIDRERQVILQEIGMVEDSPEEYIHELFSNLFYKNHSLGLPVLGTIESTSSINREGMLDHMKRFYSPDRIIIAATGDIEHEDIVEFFKPLFESIERVTNSPADQPPENESNILCLHRPLEQTHICMGGRAPSLSSNLRFAGALLNTILGGNMSSRLFQEIREKRGLAYSIYSFLSAYMDAGIFGVCLGTDTKEVNNVLRVVNREIVKILNGEVSRKELDAAREHLIGSILIGSESTDVRMIRLAKNEFIFGRYIEYDELVADLEKVTIDEIISCAKHAFAPGSVTITTLGPFKEEDLDIDGNPFFN
jgi:predicted Zn-dependent peptidase